NGLLLAAPAMLGGSDGDALKARIAVADETGERALIDAAVAYLPEDVQDAYERRSASIMSMFSNTAPAAAVTGAASPQAAEMAQLASVEEDSGHSEFNILGDL